MTGSASGQWRHTARPLPVVLLAIWVALVLFFVVPWGRFEDHSHWQRVRWVPLAPPVRVGDIVRNITLYVPLGLLLGTRRDQSTVWRIAVCAVVLSAGTELTQVFSHRRVPSTTDVTANVLGALAGLGARRTAWAAPDAAVPNPADPQTPLRSS